MSHSAAAPHNLHKSRAHALMNRAMQVITPPAALALALVWYYGPGLQFKLELTFAIIGIVSLGFMLMLISWQSRHPAVRMAIVTLMIVSAAAVVGYSGGALLGLP